ncbi:RodZ domain-containing protein [Marmoricola sp. RAF53]|uniref:RodZ domain-containing protein n=1 Tax=Marmoricola sp. RAF53 TaxID=3233059 RepID=UPI003F9BFB5B
MSSKHSAAPVVDRPAHSEAPADEVVAIRRNLLLSGIVGGLVALNGIAFLARGSWFLDVPLGLLFLVLGGLHLAALASWGVPVLVADEQGVRLRLGLSWRGLPWSSIRQVVVEHADSPLRDGRLVVVPRDLEAAVGATDALGRAHLRWNRFWYDAPLAVPLGMTTFVDTPALADDLRALSGDRVDVADLSGKELARLEEVPARAHTLEPDDAETDGTDETDAAALLPETVPGETAELPPPPEDDLEDDPEDDPDDDTDDDTGPAATLPDPVSPLRSLRRPARVEVRLEPPTPVEEPEDPAPLAATAVPSQRRPGEIAALLAGDDASGAVVLPVIDDLTPEPAPVPVIGTKIVHAREMLDMSVDELSQRTRIRPHVLEAMEVDDFGPCGGDVYARGHLGSVARVLGLDLAPLLAAYEERYAQGPINARRVFEAELSTGLSGGMRTTLGGPRWSLLVTAVLCLTMVWGLARMFADDPEKLSAAPDASSETAGLTANRQPITSPIMKTSTMTVTAAHAAAHVVVRDRTGRILWSGDLPIGHHRKVAGLAPFEVEADNGGAVTVTVKGKQLGPVGMAGKAGSKKFG